MKSNKIKSNITHFRASLDLQATFTDLYMFCLIVWFKALRPSHRFFSYVGTGLTLG